MVLVIAGSRLITDMTILHAALRTHDLWHGVTKIFSGGAPGIDSLARIYANQRGIAFDEVKADWDDITRKGAVVKYKNGKPFDAAAGPNRNRRMAQLATFEDPNARLLLIWDGQSKGSRSMLRAAQAERMIVHQYIVPIKENRLP